MGYTTVPDLMTAFPRIATTQASSATVSNWIDRASNLIDGYIAGVVPSCPGVPTPPALKDISEEIAQLMFLRRHSHEAAKEQGIQVAWEEVIKRLEDMRDGTFLILSGSGTVLSTVGLASGDTSLPWSDVQGYAPTFGLSDIEDAEVDWDRKDAEATRKI